jgi:ABC-2 type transport system permease protein
MNVGLIRKAARELWGTTLVFGLAMFAICALLAFALPRFQQQIFGKIANMPFLQDMRSAMLGTDVGNANGPEVPYGIAWSHPVLLAIFWAHAIICCTRVPAGEVDKGTIDVLLGLPVSRWQVYVSETVSWLGSAAIVLMLAVLGSLIGMRFAPPDLRLELSRLLIVIANLFALYAAVGAFAWLMSSLSDRRGRAVTAVLIVVVASFFLNYLALLWPAAGSVQFLSVLNYYRPVFPLRSGDWPWKDIGILLGSAMVLWTAGGVVFARRDLSTL